MRAFTAADTPKIGAQGDVPQAGKGPRQRLRDLVGVRSTKQRVRMTDQCDAARTARIFDDKLDGTRQAIEMDDFFADNHFKAKRSTMRPPIRCS